VPGQPFGVQTERDGRSPKDQDVCINCGLPLTGSGEQELRENVEAEAGESFIGNDFVAGGVAPGLAGGVAAIPTPLVPGEGDPDRDPPDR
jgi:hypothetical protein